MAERRDSDDTFPDSAAKSPRLLTPDCGFDITRLGAPKRRERLYSDSSACGAVESEPHPPPNYAAQNANTRLEQISLLDTFSTPHLVRNTGVICTIGELFLLLCLLSAIISVFVPCTLVLVCIIKKSAISCHSLGIAFAGSWPRNHKCKKR